MEQNELMVREAEGLVSAPQHELCPINVWTDKGAFNQMLRAADMLSKSNIVPQKYQGKPQDCFVAIEMATRIGVSPIIVMQNLNVIKGNPSWSGQACTTFINASGKFKDAKPVYTGKKGTEDRGCYVSAVRVSDGERIDGVEVTLKMAKDEGWLSNPKWRNMPELMLAYRASSFFARVYCPESLMGVQTTEELVDISQNPRSAATELSEILDEE